MHRGKGLQLILVSLLLITLSACTATNQTASSNSMQATKESTSSDAVNQKSASNGDVTQKSETTTQATKVTTQKTTATTQTVKTTTKTTAQTTKTTTQPAVPVNKTDNQTTSAAASNGSPKVDHIVIVIEENHDYKSIIGNASAPYMNQLAKEGMLFTDAHGVTHPSEPNYIALFSGSTQGVKNDSCPHTFSTPNLAVSLQEKKLTFGGYSEDMPKQGFTGCWAGSYGRKHNPWVNFTNVSDKVNLPLSSFPTDYNKLPTVSFVIPNVDHDMHDGSIKQADQWVKQHLGGYVDWAKQHNSLLILTWDEDDFSRANHIPMILVGPMVKQGINKQKVNHYDVLQLIEKIYQLAYIGETKKVQGIQNIWK